MTQNTHISPRGFGRGAVKHIQAAPKNCAKRGVKYSDQQSPPTKGKVKLLYQKPICCISGKSVSADTNNTIQKMETKENDPPTSSQGSQAGSQQREKDPVEKDPIEDVENTGESQQSEDQAPVDKPEDNMNKEKQSKWSEKGNSGDQANKCNEIQTNGSVEDQKTQDEVADVGMCIQTCKYNRKDNVGGLLLQCCLCTVWYHIKCMKITKKQLSKIEFWPCPECRTMSKSIKGLHAAIKDLKSLIMGNMGSTQPTAPLTPQTREDDRERAHLLEIIEVKSNECEELKQVNLQLKQKLDQLNGSDCDDSDESSESDCEIEPNISQLTECKRQLLIGDSLIRNVEPTADDISVACMRGAKCHDVLKKLKKDQKRYRKITIVCGTNDLSTKSDIETITDKFDALIIEAKKWSHEVTISSIPPRLDAVVKQQRLNSMNERLQVIAGTHHVNFVDNDQNFKFMSEIPDESLILTDGLHLSAKGVNRLLSNLGLNNTVKCNLASTKVEPEKGGSDETQAKHKKRPCTKSRNGVTLFFGQDSIFSNLHMSTPICIDGKTYSCNEQYYTYSMAMFHKDKQLAEKSMATNDPYELVALHKQVPNYVREKWEPEGERILYLANMAKYTQNAAAREALLNTHDNIIGEASYSTTWGIGSALHDVRSTDSRNWRGRNIMGNILMNIRSVLRKKSQRDTYAPKEKYSHQKQNKHCWFCGENNHISKNCRHGQKIQCNSCYEMGHKAKFCQY